MKSVVLWFRRDLRVADNTAFAKAAGRAGSIHPLFVLDEDILAAPDMGAARIGFLLGSLRNLASNLAVLGYPLTVRHGHAAAEVLGFCRETHAEAVFCNRDYEPYCQSRDQRVFHLLNGAGLGFEVFKDAVIWEEKELFTQAGQPYTVFTPYAKAWRAKPTPAPRVPATHGSAKPKARYRSIAIPASPADLGYPLRQEIPPGGEDAATQALTRFLDKGLLRYGEQRDFPYLAGTSGLSPHLHFGTVNVRTVLAQVYQAIRTATEAERKSAHSFVQELIWREFYVQIMTNFPRVLAGCFRSEYDALPWSGNEAHFQAWCAGQSGYPLIDAAMRCLNATGWMHNRLRMVVSMFLSKDLLLPWQWGERYFMRRLVDGDHAANNGGWQWSAGTGTDAAPYFRIFNPTAQAERFDPEGEFTRRWIPELEGIAGKAVHRPWAQPQLAAHYPPPIVRHEIQRAKCLAMFQTARKGGRKTATREPDAGRFHRHFHIYRPPPNE